MCCGVISLLFGYKKYMQFYKFYNFMQRRGTMKLWKLNLGAATINLMAIILAILNGIEGNVKFVIALLNVICFFVCSYNAAEAAKNNV